MNVLVSILATRSWVGLILRCILIVEFIILLDFIAIYQWRLLPFVPPLQLAAFVAALSAPVALLFLVVFRHILILQDQLVMLATTDPLTGLMNRRAFIANVAPDGALTRDGAFVMLDIDHFKSINDRFGHDTGDRCLEVIAEGLRASLRADDVIARFGGEEFALFLPQASASQLQAIGQRIADGTVLEVDGSETEQRTTLSGGAVMARAGDPFHLIAKRADEALYRAKSAGRARLIALRSSEWRRAISARTSAA